MVILDGSIVAVGLPAIQSDLGLSGPVVAWVVNAYLVPFGGMLLLAGRLGDLLGARRVLLAGVGLFTAASLLCGQAPDAGVLIGARVAQGIGAALASAVVLGTIVGLFPEPGERGRAVAVFGFVGAAGSSLGLLAGGVLVQVCGWHSIFLINVPLGVAAVVGIRRVVPNPAGTGDRADLPGAILVTAGLALAIYTLLSAGARSGTTTVLLGLGALGLLAGFLAREHRERRPLLPLHLLLDRRIGLGNLVQALMIAGLFGFQFLGVLYLQDLLGYDALRAGLAFLPIPLGIAAVSLGLTAGLMSRLGSRPVLLCGLGSTSAGLLLLTRLSVPGSYVTQLLPAGLLLAAGFGLAFPALAGIAVAAPEEHAGVASGLFNATQQIGGALGLAVLSFVATRGRPGLVPLDGYHRAFATAAVSVALAFLVGLAATADPARRTSASRAGLRTDRPV